MQQAYWLCTSIGCLLHSKCWQVSLWKLITGSWTATCIQRAAQQLTVSTVHCILSSGQVLTVCWVLVPCVHYVTPCQAHLCISCMLPHCAALLDNFMRLGYDTWCAWKCSAGCCARGSIQSTSPCAPGLGKVHVCGTDFADGAEERVRRLAASQA